MLSLVANQATAQRPRFSDYFSNHSVPATPVQFQVSAQNPGNIVVPNGSIINSPPAITTTPPPSTYQLPQVQAAPPFDPFQTNSNPFPQFQSQGNVQTFPNGMMAPQGQLPQLQVPNTSGQMIQPQGAMIGQPYFQDQGFQTAQNNSSWWPTFNSAWPSQTWTRMRTDFFPRFLQRPRVRHTWISGTDGNELGINDLELATTATFGNFFGTGQPWRLSPVFIFHWLDGPDTMVHPGFELPASVYSAFLGFDYLSDLNRKSGIETNVNVGFYSDFHNTSSDGIRVTGVGLGWVRLNPYTTAKLGVEYLDRVKVKLLPAFGVFMAPNSELKIDLFFPRPKVAHRLPRFANGDVWLYAGGEYGGGSWVVDLDAVMPMSDQVDVNDVRAFMGIEWLGPRQNTGFFEIGYVFERELIYRSDRRELDLQDALMLRYGVAF